MRKTITVKIEEVIKQNLFFFIPYLLFLILGLLAIIFLEKETINIYLNRMHNGFLDLLFRVLTFFGDGIFIIAVLIPILLLFRVKYALQCSLVYSISGLIAQLIKHLTDTPRPLLYLYQKGILEHLNLYIMNNIDIFYFNSFPSGHSATAFSTCLLMSMFLKNKISGFFFFVIAFFIGFSRIYLLQHFFVDVYVGSIIGVLVSKLIYLTFINWEKIKLNYWYDWSLGIYLRSIFCKK